MQVQTKGEFGGLGIEVTQEEGVVKVVSPIEGTPADKAGIKTGDLITAVNGESVMGLNLNDAVDLMRGPVGSEITITIVREGTPSPSTSRSRVKRSRSRPSARGWRMGWWCCA